MKYFDDSILMGIKEYARDNLGLYSESDSSWVFDYLNDSRIEQKEKRSELITGPEDPSKYDFQNAKKIYELYKDVPIELASEENFWAYLTHVEFWDYMIKRWPIDKKESTMISRYFFGKAKPYYRNGLSRLWWYAHVTYDNELEDPYFYTRIALKEQERAALLLETVNISRNRTALFATLDVLSNIDKWKENDEIYSIKDERNTVLRPLMSYINGIGGVMIWDLLTSEEATKKIMTFIDQLKEDGVIKFKELVPNQ